MPSPRTLGMAKNSPSRWGALARAWSLVRDGWGVSWRKTLWMGRQWASGSMLVVSRPGPLCPVSGIPAAPQPIRSPSTQPCRPSSSRTRPRSMSTWLRMLDLSLLEHRWAIMPPVRTTSRQPVAELRTLISPAFPTTPTPRSSPWVTTQPFSLPPSQSTTLER